MDPQAVRDAYDAVAAEYAGRFADELSHKPFDRKMLDWLAERAAPLGSVADLGCGPGHVAAYLQRRGLDVRGIDLSPEMVRQARILNPGVPFECADMLDLAAVPDASLGGIVAFYSLVHFDDGGVDRALREMHRTLKAGGILLAAVHLGEGTVDVERFLDRDSRLSFRFFSSDALRHRIAEAGFTITEGLEREPYPGVEYPSRRAYVFATASASRGARD
jgi:SAM-dependent methyltransferase